MPRTIFIGACLLMACGLASATTSFTVYGTGFTNTGTVQTAGLADGNWTLESDPTATGECASPCAGQVTAPASPFVTDGSDTTFPFPNWLADTSTSQWISPHADESTNSDPFSATTTPYVYQETFTIPVTLNASTAVIVGQWSADNDGSIVVNGTPVTTNGTGADGIIPSGTLGAFSSFVAFTLNSTNATFHTGSNTIAFDVFNNSNGSPDVTGLNVVIASATASSAVPEPATFGLLGLGLGALGLVLRRKRR